jgi:sec-independent protein translocase protein TatA
MVGDILQPTHLLFILVVALLVLGPKRLPEVGRTLGSGLRDFKSAINGESTHDDHETRGFVETEASSTADDSDADTIVHHTVDDEGDDESAWEPAETATATTTASHDDDMASDEPETVTAVHDEVHSSPVPSAQPAPKPVATASSSGFASALAASRQPTGDDATDDE